MCRAHQPGLFLRAFGPHAAARLPHSKNGMRPYVLAAFGLGGKPGGDGYRTHQHGCRTPKTACAPTTCWSRFSCIGNARGDGRTGALPCAPTVHGGAGAAIATMVVAVETRAHCHAPLRARTSPPALFLRAFGPHAAARLPHSKNGVRPYVLAAFGLGGKPGGDGYRTHQHGCRTPKRAVGPYAAIRPYDSSTLCRRTCGAYSSSGLNVCSLYSFS
ncbi:hypothetical protein HRbin30_00588 [bacterium HR30]|nr:hypothetical protein HRbin30_00588 [bacterium HR30]